MKRFILALLISGLAFSCNQPQDRGDKPVISVSILPQQYFVRQLAGDLVEINVMIPPGASPATYEPTVSQLGKLEQSASYLRIGHVGFELSWMDKISAVNPEMKIVDLSRGVVLIVESEEEAEHPQGHDHGGTDPHIWLSVKNSRIIARNIYQELLMMFPDHQEELSSRFEKFSASLDSLHQVINNKLDGLENRSFMIYHPALTYFASEYNLTQYSLEIEGKSPSPAHLRLMTDLGRSHKITRILIQDQFDRRNAEVLAREIGAEIVQFDPLDPCWMDQMLYIADLFKSTRP
jgi:zinc transport system substrate-binding protein